MENQARIVVDTEDHGQLQLEIETLIQDDQRRDVLLYTALKSVMALEQDIATMEANKIEMMHAAIKAEENPPIYGPNGHDRVSSQQDSMENEGGRGEPE